MAWFYQLPLEVACLIVFPLIIYLIYYLIKYKDLLRSERNGNALIATFITVQVGGVYAIFLKAIDKYQLFLEYKSLFNTILFLFLLIFFLTLLWNGIIIYKNHPERRKLLRLCLITFIAIVIFLITFYFFKVRK